MRWDAIHFLATAERGYQYEQQWAFLPGISTTIRSFNGLLGHEHGLKGVSLLISLLTVDSFRVLHELSRIHLGSDDLAHITCVLALIPSSPATLFAAPYNEPFFTYLSYRGTCSPSLNLIWGSQSFVQGCCSALVGNGYWRPCPLQPPLDSAQMECFLQDSSSGEYSSTLASLNFLGSAFGRFSQPYTQPFLHGSSSYPFSTTTTPAITHSACQML